MDGASNFVIAGIITLLIFFIMMGLVLYLIFYLVMKRSGVKEEVSTLRMEVRVLQEEVERNKQGLENIKSR
ncbi:hypothetical protein EDO6_03464 [Paenibacillus xylanexedens]|nr:hypothetical protein EDO6_03464 [Paenibacillus xylanexedens]